MRKDLSLQSEDRRMSESDGRQIRISSSGTCFISFSVLPLGRVARYHNKHPTIQPNIRLRSSCLLVSINQVRFSKRMLNKCSYIKSSYLLEPTEHSSTHHPPDVAASNTKSLSRLSV